MRLGTQPGTVKASLVVLGDIAEVKERRVVSEVLRAVMVALEVAVKEETDQSIF